MTRRCGSWDTGAHTPIGAPLQGHVDAVRCVSFSADGRRAVSGSRDGTVRIWNAGTRQQIGEALSGHSSPARRVSESADGCHIVSQHCDGITVIREREDKAIVWKSKNIEHASQGDATYEQTGSDTDTTDAETDDTDWEDAFENEIASDEAEETIQEEARNPTINVVMKARDSRWSWLGHAYACQSTAWCAKSC